MTGFRAIAGVPVTYGHGIVAGLGDQLGEYHVYTQPEAWALVEGSLGAAPASVTMVDDLSPEALDALADALPATADSVLGVGGGTAMDVAKWVHWRRGVSLHQIPTLPSVNACFTRMSALRDGGKVRYEGNAIPTMVHVDLDILQGAPRELLSAGIGDVLSCHTALWDWRIAVAAGHDPAWDDEGAGASLRYIDGLAAAAPGLRLGTDEGITSLMEMHREVGWRCHELQHARFEEGSEHFFAYCYEQVTGHTILHGELVSLGVLIMTGITDQQHDIARAIVANAGTRHRPQDLGIEWADIDATLRLLPQFVEEGGYWYSRLNGLVITDEILQKARDAVDF